MCLKYHCVSSDDLKFSGGNSCGFKKCLHDCWWSFNMLLTVFVEILLISYTSSGSYCVLV